MKELVKKQVIEDNFIHLSSNQYYKTLMNQLHQRNILNQEKVQQIQLELLQLLSKQVAKYTSGESSSVTTNKASQIIESIYYGMGIYLKSVDINNQIEIINTWTMEKLYQQGIELMKKIVLEAKQILASVKNKAIHTKNKAYQDTIYTGLPLFFRDYDLKFAAQDDTGSIDYPLLKEIINLSGIEYIREYLIRLNYENLLLKSFHDELIEKLLRGYNKDYSDLLINISDMVITNALGLIILEKDFFSLNITEEDRVNLFKIWIKKNEKEIYADLTKAYEILCIKLKLTDRNQIAYLRGMIGTLSKVIMKQIELNRLDTIFVTHQDEYKEVGPIYEEGHIMPDEDLRTFIEKMKECRFLSDKISMVKEQVHSLSDLIEIMKECFYGNEFLEVFSLLSDMELSVLGQYLKAEKINNELYYVYEPTEMYQEYFKFINNSDK